MGIHDATENDDAFSVCEAGGNDVCWIGSNNNVASWTDGSSPSGFTDWQSPAPRAQYPYVLLWFGGWAGGPEEWTQYPLCNAIPATTNEPSNEPTAEPTAEPTTSNPTNNPTAEVTAEIISETVVATTSEGEVNSVSKLSFVIPNIFIICFLAL